MRMSRHRKRERDFRGRAKRGPVIFFVAVIVLSASILVISARRPSGKSFSIETKGPSSATAQPERLPTRSMPQLIPVHIDGAVNDPGVYYVKDGTLLVELIELAGGFAEDADRSPFNLAMRLSAHMKVFVPRIGVPLSQEPVQGQDPLQQKDLKIDLNKATREQLETLPGIGPATADAIISFRETNGAFETIEDLMLVPGIKEGRFARLKDQLTISSP